MDRRIRTLQALLLLQDSSDLTGSEIARDLDVRFPTVVDWRTRLERKGIWRVVLDVESALAEIGYTEAEYWQARSPLRMERLEAELAPKSGGVEVVVVKVWKPSDKDAVQRQVTWAAASHVCARLESKKNKLRRGVTWGVSYGFTAHLFCRKFAEVFDRKRVRLPEGGRVFNMSGAIVSPLKGTDLPRLHDESLRTLYSSSLEHARMLAESLGAELLEYWGPGFIPLNNKYPTPTESIDHSHRMSGLVQEYDWNEVYSGARHAADADLLVSGIGSRQSYQAVLNATHRGIGHPVTKAALDRVVGDISGVALLDKGGKLPPEVEALESTVVMRREIFRKVAARNRFELGSIGVASGNEKAQAVAAALQSDDRLLSTLILDEQLALKVLEILRKAPPIKASVAKSSAKRRPSSANGIADSEQVNDAQCSRGPRIARRARMGSCDLLRESRQGI